MLNESKVRLGKVVGVLMMVGVAGCTRGSSKGGASVPVAGSKGPGVAKRGVVDGSEACVREIDVGDAFASRGVEGVFVLRRERDGCVAWSDAELAKTGFRPQSTFKIPNAMIGLELGLISGAQHVWKWDGQPQSNRRWEQDLNLKDALNYSCVPCFRSLAREIGVEQMREYVGKMGYGNQNIEGGIDLFWLNGALRISPVEQVEFVHRSLAGELPVKREYVELVWEDLEQAPVGDIRVFAKTGLGQQDGRGIGWVVGYLEKGSMRWGFATFLRTPAGEDAQEGMGRLMPLRMQVLRELVENVEPLRK